MWIKPVRIKIYIGSARAAWFENQVLAISQKSYDKIMFMGIAKHCGRDKMAAMLHISSNPYASIFLAYGLIKDLNIKGSELYCPKVITNTF